MSIKNLHNSLVQHVKGQSGNITVNLGGIKAVITGKDAIGHLIQEWLFTWSNSHGYNILPNPSTQSFPDYTLNGESLEIKNFNYDATPAFDVADAYQYIETIDKDIEKIYADYLIFGYTLDASGNLTIKDIWLKKIWEIIGKSPTNFVTSQIRRDKKNPMNSRLQKFRPYNFKNTNPHFSNPKDFLKEVQNLLLHLPATQKQYNNWLSTINSAHIKKFGRPL